VSRVRALVIAEACNPEWVSVPLEGWSHYEALARVADVHLVTQVRNGEALERAGLVAGRDFTAIDSEAVARPVHRLAERLRGGAGRGWGTVTATRVLSTPWFEWLLWRRFAPDLRAGRFDLVHQLTPLSPVVPAGTAPRCRRVGVPFTWGPINGGVPWPPGFDEVRRAEGERLWNLRGLHWLMPGYRASRRDSAALLVGSRATWEQIEPRWREKCEYVPENAIDPARFTRRRERRAALPVRAAFVGRLVPYKGADMLLDAAEPLLRAGKLELLIVGDGPQMPWLRGEVARRGVEGAVDLAGWVEHREVQARLAGCDVFAFPSIHEFGGAVVLEAMAVGVVPIVVAHGGPAELVTERSGWRVPVGTRPEIVSRLRGTLEEVCADPAEIDRRAPHALRRVFEQFTWDRKAGMTLAVWEWVLGRGPKPCFPMPLPDPQDP
jgi:glycosyltransferase involved in cell wall biosynthesis